MHDFEMILIFSLLIFIPILMIYPIFRWDQKKVSNIKNLALNHPELIESLELYEGEDLVLIVKLKNMTAKAIAYENSAKELYATLKNLKNSVDLRQ